MVIVFQHVHWNIRAKKGEITCSALPPGTTNISIASFQSSWRLDTSNPVQLGGVWDILVDGFGGIKKGRPAVWEFWEMKLRKICDAWCCFDFAQGWNLAELSRLTFLAPFFFFFFFFYYYYLSYADLAVTILTYIKENPWRDEKPLSQSVMPFLPSPPQPASNGWRHLCHHNRESKSHFNSWWLEGVVGIAMGLASRKVNELRRQSQ